VQLSVADIDWTKLGEHERWTLEQAIPLREDGWEVPAIAVQLGVDLEYVRVGFEALAAQVMALSGRNELPPHTPEEYEALKASIRTIGQQVHILRGSPSSGIPGQIVDGHARSKICAELNAERLRKGKPTIAPLEREIDGTADELRSLGLVLNLARRHLSASSRRGLIQVELVRDANRSDREISATLGVSPTTVGSVRRRLEEDGTVSKLDTRLDKNGVERPADAAQERPVPKERSLRLLVDADRFDSYVGPWVRCQAFRMIERRPNVYELQVQLIDPELAGETAIAETRVAAATLAELLGRQADDVLAELIRNAAEVFGRTITGPAELYTDEAAWATTRMTELTEMARV
jgi:ParB-like chromosome segregation protein Spo0J